MTRCLLTSSLNFQAIFDCKLREKLFVMLGVYLNIFTLFNKEYTFGFLHLFLIKLKVLFKTAKHIS